MIQVESFTFNPFSENTYLLYDQTGECLIIDPGCHNEAERKRLVAFIEKKKLTPVLLINTHCHVDHVAGNRFVADKYNIPLAIHEGEVPVLAFALQSGMLWGFRIDESPKASVYLVPGETLRFGESELEILFTPGHSPASICLYSKQDSFVIGGDVLFRGSIGRTDLPGGSYRTLIKSIEEQLLPLGDEVVVYSGHGPATTIGYERLNNPFLNE
ncbi:MAG: MBL fold metallo-hydrolase [Sphingobacteriales bacterium]|nr:MAG: MBL fold metallo-hydrolase [Sphingobacteriales bacterium]